jgi:uncharacterized membrane protein
MSSLTLAKVYAVSVAFFLLIDLTWLGLIAKNVYGKYLGHLMRPMPNWPAALTFYLLFLVGLMIFVLQPALQQHSWQHALLFGALFGFFTYATFDLTSLAVLKDWPWQIVIIDMVWGTVLAGSVSVLTYFVSMRLFNI